jgi:glutamine amidotransferase
MSQFEDPTEDLEVAEIIEGIQKLIRIILDLKVKYNIKGQDILKLFLADRNDLCVANVGIGPNRTLEIEGCWEELKQFPVGTPEFTLSRLTSPVWALKGKKFGQKEGSYQMEAVADEEVRSVIIASEPLTENNQNWVKIPFQHLCYFDYNNGNPKLELIPFNI